MIGSIRKIKNWPKSDRPQEKLYQQKPHALSNAELLSILIGPGNARSNAVELAKEVLAKCKGSLNELGKCTVDDLIKIRGIGRKKASTIVAFIELSRRRQSELPLTRPKIKDSRDAAAFLRPLLADYHHEVFGVMYLDSVNRLKNFEIISQGGLVGTVVDARILFRKAIENEAVKIIVCHNHPSGSPNPSANDELLTEKLYQGVRYLDIKLLDHIIVGGSNYFSFADSGKLP